MREKNAALYNLAIPVRYEFKFLTQRTRRKYRGHRLGAGNC